jgi:putative oxidoreductase
MKHVTLSGNMPKRNSFALFVEKNKSKIVEVIAALFMLLFLYTALSKSHDITRTINVVKKSPLLSNYAALASWAVVGSEYAAVLLLFFPKTRKIGLYLSLILMSSFTIYIGYMMAFVPDLPCSCGGVISKLTWKQHLFFNIFFTLLSIWGIGLCKKQNTQQEDSISSKAIFT